MHSKLPATLTEQDAAALAAGYLRYVAVLRQDDDDTENREATRDEAAYDIVKRLVEDGSPGTAWLAVRELLRQTPDDDLEVSAAGPLEDLVRAHGFAIAGELLAEAERDDRFRWALGCIWIGPDSVPTSLYEVVRQARQDSRA